MMKQLSHWETHGVIWKWSTLPKTNIVAPENRPFAPKWDESSSMNFQGQTVSFREGILKYTGVIILPTRTMYYCWQILKKESCQFALFDPPQMGNSMIPDLEYAMENQPVGYFFVNFGSPFLRSIFRHGAESHPAVWVEINSQNPLPKSREIPFSGN